MSPYKHNITLYAKCQADAESVLDEPSWAAKKQRNALLADAYLYLAQVRQPGWADYWRRRYEVVQSCSTFLVFSEDEQGRRLKSMVSCKDRLCPLCQWRRSLKTFSNVKRIVDYIAEHGERKYRYIFMTLTIKNCKRDELQATVDEMFQGLKRFVNQRGFKAAIKGFFRSFEVTHNVDFDTFHPHFHLVCAVNPSYFKGKTYLSHAEICRLWALSMRLDYNPVCNIKAVDNLDGAAAEISKYATKDADILDVNDWDLTADTVAAVHDALKGRRLVAYGGIMQQLHKQLNLDDEDTGDLVHVGDELLPTSPEAWEVTYMWCPGYYQYRRIDRHTEQIDT